MKLKHMHFYPREDGTHYSKADLIVPGLGEVSIEQALSEETMRKLEAEAVAALRIKLGQTIQVSEKPEPEIPS